MTDTSRITEEDGVLVIRDLFGDTVRIRGVITAVDFEANTVVIRTEE